MKQYFSPSIRLVIAMLLFACMLNTGFWSLSAWMRKEAFDIPSSSWVTIGMMGVMYYLYFSYYLTMVLRRHTPLQLLSGEEEVLLQNAAYLPTDHPMQGGTLYLTNRRVCFIPAHAPGAKPSIDLYLTHIDAISYEEHLFSQELYIETTSMGRLKFRVFDKADVWAAVIARRFASN